MTYKYRREDDGTVVEVDFQAAIMQDAAGFITLPDGVAARRIHEEAGGQESDTVSTLPFLPVSDALGVTESQVDEMREDARIHGFTGVEFTPDPMVQGFYQVRFSSRDEWDRYVAHRGFVDKHRSSGGGAAMTAGQLQRTAEIVWRVVDERSR